MSYKVYKWKDDDEENYFYAQLIWIQNKRIIFAIRFDGKIELPDNYDAIGDVYAIQHSRNWIQVV